MHKPDHLRAHLTQALPELARHPDKLLLFVDEGNLIATGAPGLAFEYRYTLTLILTDYTGSPDAVMVPLLDWLHVHQSELLMNPDRRDGIRFEADILANNQVDLQIQLPLTERVGVQQTAPGEFTTTHYPEPGA